MTTRLELLSLTQTHEVCHPSKIESFTLHNDNSASFSITGLPWWLEGQQNSFDAKLTLELHGISEGNLNFHDLGSSFEEDLEDFWIKKTRDVPWIAYPHCTVYCNSTLKEPLDIYLALDTYLFKMGSPYRAEHFVHADSSGTLSSYLQLTRGNSFFLCHGAKTVCELAVQLATQQRCSTTVIEHEVNRNDLLWVNIGQTYAICSEAYAVY